MTYTGCVQEGTTPGTFTLTNVSTTGGTSGSSSGAGTGTSGTSGTGTSGPRAAAARAGTSSEASMGTMTYELVPAKGVELKAHVGHKVQVTGTMDDEQRQECVRA